MGEWTVINIDFCGDKRDRGSRLTKCGREGNDMELFGAEPVGYLSNVLDS